LQQQKQPQQRGTSNCKILPPLQNFSPTVEFFPHRDNRPRKQNPSKKTKKTKKQRFRQCLETARTDRQTDTPVDLIYKIAIIALSRAKPMGTLLVKWLYRILMNLQAPKS
jgi:hypothetical protein